MGNKSDVVLRQSPGAISTSLKGTDLHAGDRPESQEVRAWCTGPRRTTSRTLSEKRGLRVGKEGVLDLRKSVQDICIVSNPTHFQRPSLSLGSNKRGLYHPRRRSSPSGRGRVFVVDDYGSSLRTDGPGKSVAPQLHSQPVGPSTSVEDNGQRTN